MRTTVTLDDDLFSKASAAVDAKNASEVVTIALQKLVAAESRKRLIGLGGTMPDFEVPGRNIPAAGVEGARGMSLVAEDPSPYPAKP